MFDAATLKKISEVCVALDGLGEIGEYLYLEVRLMAEGEPCGRFTDELGSWMFEVGGE